MSQCRLRCFHAPQRVKRQEEEAGGGLGGGGWRLGGEAGRGLVEAGGGWRRLSFCMVWCCSVVLLSSLSWPVKSFGRFLPVCSRSASHGEQPPAGACRSQAARRVLGLNKEQGT